MNISQTKQQNQLTIDRKYQSKRNDGSYRIEIPKTLLFRYRFA